MPKVDPRAPGAAAADAQADERALLAALLRSGETEGGGTIDDVAEMLCAEDFAWHAHQLLFRAIIDVRAAGEPVLAASVHEQFRQRGQLAEFSASAATWLADLLELAATSAHAVFYAGRVRDRARLRRVAGALAEASAQVADPTGSAEEVVGRVEALVLHAAENERADSGPELLGALVEQELRAIDERAFAETVGLNTGYRELDGLVCGLRGGQFVILAARPGGGKSALAASIAENVAVGGVRVLFSTLEMSGGEVTQRLIAGRSAVPLLAIRAGKLTPTQVDRVSDAACALKKLPLEIDERSSLTVTRLAAIARRAVRRRGCGLIVLDYIQLLAPENPREARHLQVGAQARALKTLARELNVPVLALAQLNREIEHRNDPRPRLADLRDSGELEQHADIVLLLHEPKEQPDPHRAAVEVLVAKNRNGPTGTATLARVRATTRFAA